MNHKKTIVFILIIICIWLSGLHAQSTMYVRDLGGSQTSYTLTNIQKLTFSGGYMYVDKTSGGSDNFLISDIRYLNFTDLTTTNPLLEQVNYDYNLFPNPTTDQLQISFKSKNVENVQIEIVDMLGRVLITQSMTSATGSNLATISVSQLTKGFYICRIQCESNIETIDFIKN